MKQSLHLKLSQHLTMTPQLQQSIKLLQLSTVEMNQELERYLLENPLLERVDAASEASIPLISGYENGNEQTAANDARRDQDQDRGSIEGDSSTESNDGQHEFADSTFGNDVPYTNARNNGQNDDDSEYAQLPAAEPALQEHLINQLQLKNLSDTDRKITLVLIAHLDDDGYLTHDLDDLTELISAHIDIDPEEMITALFHLQNLEPVGVGARNLAECLSLQLRALPVATPGRAKAMTLAASHLDVLASRDFLRLRRLLDCDEEELKQVRTLIVSLDPRPGSHFSQGDIRYVVPDVVVKKIGGKWVASLNREAMPKLRINKLYADLLQSNRDGSGKNLSGQLQEARWLIKNIAQRFDTILRVTQAIVERQRNFFDHGEVAMRPLVLQEIADQVGLHESTISRVTTQKYMLTQRGIFELKYFFGSSVSTDTGGECSAIAIRALIKQLVQAEDGKKPLSDHKISDILSEQGIVVARRTVAKYREAMQINPASQRKAF